jgi:hypothetical protein
MDRDWPTSRLTSASDCAYISSCALADFTSLASNACQSSPQTCDAEAIGILVEHMECNLAPCAEGTLASVAITS